MLLRSGSHYQSEKMSSFEKRRKKLAVDYYAFRRKCQYYIGKLNDATYHNDRVHILYKLYSYIYDEKDCLSSYIYTDGSIIEFLYRIASDIPRFIREIIYVCRDSEIPWSDMTGLDVMQDAYIFYELRQFLLMIIEWHTE